MPVELALVGAAHIHTPGFIKRIQARNDVRVKYVWDHDAARAELRATELGATTVADPAAIWNDAAVTGVVVCSETNRHEPLVMAAAAAGKHLFVEKPLGLKHADAAHMADAIEAAGVIFQTGYFMRGQPVHQFLRQQIQAGHFGKITRVRHSNCHNGSLGRWFDAGWLWMTDLAQAGVGSYGDLGTHSLDILMWLLGDVARVTATVDAAVANYGETDEFGEGILVFENGVVGTLAAGWVDVQMVGISMPTKSSARWISDGENMVKVFRAGYKTDLQFAEDDIPNQLAQIENMVTKGAKVLVIAAIDGTTLSDALQKAHDKGILVIAYDRLITNTDNVDYYATFDNFQVGVLQAQQIETDALGPEGRGKGPFNIELFGGSPDDTNAFYFYDGAMSSCSPSSTAASWWCAAGQMGMDKVSTLRWDGAVAQARMDNLLSAFYGDKRVDAVLSPVRRPEHRHPLLAQGRGLRHRRAAHAGRHRPGRRDSVGQVDPGRRAVLHDLQGHARTGQGHGQDGRRRAAGRKCRSTTPRPTTTA
jgi:predicted dehydrogenase